MGEDGRAGAESDFMWEGLDLPLWGLKTEEGKHSQGMWAATKTKKQRSVLPQNLQKGVQLCQHFDFSPPPEGQGDQ